MQILSRRQALMLSLVAPLVPLESGCRASLPPSTPGSSREALALLWDSADAHGLPAYKSLRDVNVSYAGRWRRLVGVLQPALVDAGFRGGSEERLLLHDGVVAQSHTGPKGHKQVVRTYDESGTGDIRVWFNGEEAHDRTRIDAAALVTDAYALFLLGPLLLATNERPRRDIVASLAGTASVGRGRDAHSCDVVIMVLRPGLGNADSDQVALYFDRHTRLMLRVRMTLNGLESTQGALADIDTSDHRLAHGILWPTMFHEKLLRPAPLDVHRWTLTGLDVNRGESRSDFPGHAFGERAAARPPRLPAAY